MVGIIHQSNASVCFWAYPDIAWELLFFQVFALSA